MSLEEILHTFNSPPSKMCVTGIDYIRTKVSKKFYDFIVKANHLEYIYSDSYVRISDEALRVILNKNSNDIIEAYLAF